MFDHMGFTVRDLRKSLKFYEMALAPLGIKLMKFSEEHGFAAFGIDQPRFWLGSGNPTNGPDELHLCFATKSRSEVRAFYEAAIRAGGTDNGAPGLRPIYHENYYGAFVLDPDGNGIEACCHLPE